MSQVIKNLASGPVPPAVPTSFVTDDGTAIPAANILNVNGVDSTENNANGILTRANPDLSDNLEVVITNRLQGTVTTADATPTPIITFTPTVIGTYTIETRIGAYNTTDTLGAGYSLFGTARYDGVNSNLCGTADRIVNEEAGMETASVTFTVSGANILINAVGIAAKTINWSAVGLYTFVGA
jgi:hypothetical protein